MQKNKSVLLRSSYVTLYTFASTIASLSHCHAASFLTIIRYSAGWRAARRLVIAHCRGRSSPFSSRGRAAAWPNHYSLAVYKSCNMTTSTASNKTSEEDASQQETSSKTEIDSSSTTKPKNDSSSLHDLTRQLEVLEIGGAEDGVSEEFFKVAQWIRDASNILVLSGAGVSCSAGIPDFRTPGTGLYDNLQKYSLPYPEAVFDLGFYQKDPKPFCSLAQEIWPGEKHSPTYTHSFVAMLSQQQKLLRNYTQNIDGLEFLASIPSEQIVECHGHFRKASCTKCQSGFDGDECKNAILNNKKTPKCKRCGGFVKPDIVFFGEGLPERYGRLLRRDLNQVDLLLIMGTSLSVAPVSMVPEMVSCKRVLINRELVGNISKKRDVFLEGDCDDTVQILSRLLQWQDDLLALNKSTRIEPKKEKNNPEKS